VRSFFVRLFVLVNLAVISLAGRIVAHEAGLSPLSGAFESIRQQIGRWIPSHRGAPELPKPDRATLEVLASRVPGLAVDKVRLVPAGVALAVMKQAADEKLTYLQFLTGERFKRDEIYYVSKEVIAAVEEKYATGTVPFSGVTTDGKPFRMEGFLGGQGRLHYLYDLRQDFRFKDVAADRDFMIKNGGHVEARVLAPADLSLQGLSVHAMMGMFTDIQRMTQTSATRVHVTTAMGAGDGDVVPIRAR